MQSGDVVWNLGNTEGILLERGLKTEWQLEQHQEFRKKKTIENSGRMFFNRKYYSIFV